MAEYTSLKQNNTGWNLSWSALGRYPMVAKRRFPTLADAQAFVDDVSVGATATEGLIISVINDTGNTKNNGVYYIKSVANNDAEYGPILSKGTLIKVGGTETETADNYSAAVVLSSGLTVGQLIKVLSAQTITVDGKELTYQAGFYIVEAPGTISALATSTGSDDEVGALKARVTSLEANKADLTGLTALTKTVSDNYNTYDAHAKDEFIHITQDERTIWNQAHTWSSGNTIEISSLKSVVNTKADASALTNYLLAENAYDDTEVRGLITAEATARTEAFNTLSGAVDTKVSVNDFNTLTGTVESNYNTLNGLITAETEARVNAITSLTETVNTKASINDLTAHTSSSDIHVTTDDKNKWNKVVEDFNTFITGDTEAALNTLVDLQQWISEHGTEAQAMATAITANLESITSLTQTVDTISGKVDNNTTAITKNAEDIATKAAQSDLEALAEIVGNETDKSGIFDKLNTLAGNVENKLTKSATVNGKSFSEDGALVIDSADINLNEGFGKKLVNEVETDRYTTSNTIQYVLKDIDTRIDAINTTIDNVTGGGVIADITEGDGISVDKSSKTTPTVSVNTDDSSVTIDSNKKISVKLSTSENNALSVDGNGLFVQAITIDGNDAETE
jgi:hypothetical protein